MFGKWSRRNLLQSSGAVAGAAAMAPVAAVAAGTEPAKRDMAVHTGTPEDNVFTRVGVRPILNARGTYTIISGSRSLPEGKQALVAGGPDFLQMGELVGG